LLPARRADRAGRKAPSKSKKELIRIRRREVVCTVPFSEKLKVINYNLKSTLIILTVSTSSPEAFQLSTDGIGSSHLTIRA